MDKPTYVDNFAATFEQARKQFAAGVRFDDEGNAWESHLEFSHAQGSFELAAKFARTPADKRTATRWARSAAKNAARYQPTYA